MLDPRQGAPEPLGALLVQVLLQGPRAKARLEDALHRQAVVGVVAHGMYQRPVDVVAVVGVLQKQDAPGVIAAVAREALLQAHEEVLGGLAQRQKRLSHRLQAVADLLGMGAVLRQLSLLVG